MRTGRSRPLPPAKREASQLRASDEEGSFAVAGLGRRGKLRILVLGRRGPLSGVICAASSDACRFTASGAPNSPLHALGTKNYPRTWVLSRPLGTSNSRRTWALSHALRLGIPNYPPPHMGASARRAHWDPQIPRPPPHRTWTLSHVARPVNPESLHRTWALLCAARLGNARLSLPETTKFPPHLAFFSFAAREPHIFPPRNPKFPPTHAFFFACCPETPESPPNT